MLPGLTPCVRREATMPAAVRAPHFVRSFERGLAVIRSFDAEHPARTLGEVARACLPAHPARPGTRLRLPRRLHTAADRDPASGATRRPHRGVGVPVRPRRRRRRPRRLSAGPPRPGRHHHRGHATARPRHRRGPGAPRPSAPGELETRRPTGALRRELDRIRHEGHALVDPELEEGIRAVAAPVRDRDGAVVAGVSIAMPAGRCSVDAVRRDLLPQLLAVAALIDDDLRIRDPARAASRGSARHR